MDLNAHRDIGAELEQSLVHLGLLDKAHQIYSELGEKAVVSYIQSYSSRVW